MKPIRWGILACGTIAHAFAEACFLVPDCVVGAVGSRTLSKAEAFAASYGIDRAYGSYEELVADPTLDAIYVASPHSEHRAHTLLALRAGKHVLCEKAFAVNAGQAREMIAEAEKQGRFLMEAMWTRFLPVYGEVKRLLETGAIGSIKMVRANFSIRCPADPVHRLYNPALAGGALLDVGLYPLTLATMVFGSRPNAIHTAVSMTPQGVDEQSVITLEYGDGRLASLTSGLSLSSPNDGLILGSDGYIRIPRFWAADSYYLHQADSNIAQAHSFSISAFDDYGDPKENPQCRLADQYRSRCGYTFEIREANRCIRQGLLQSPEMPWSESVAMLELTDAIRGKWGLRYPFE